MALMHCLRLAGLAPVPEGKQKENQLRKNLWFLLQVVKIFSAWNDLVGVSS